MRGESPELKNSIRGRFDSCLYNIHVETIMTHWV